MRAAEPALGLLGLAARAGATVPGTERVREAARGDSLRLAILARDASENSRGKLLPLLDSRGIAYVRCFDRAQLGAAVGRSALSAVGIVQAGFADRFLALLRTNA